MRTWHVYHLSKKVQERIPYRQCSLKGIDAEDRFFGYDIILNALLSIYLSIYLSMYHI